MQQAGHAQLRPGRPLWPGQEKTQTVRITAPISLIEKMGRVGTDEGGKANVAMGFRIAALEYKEKEVPKK